MSFTPKLKFLFILINLEKFFIFFKFNIFLYFLNKTNAYVYDYLFIFLKVFFFKSYIRILNNMNLDLVGNYTNNLIKSSIYCIFIRITRFFNNKKIDVIFNFINNYYFFNLYFYSVKNVNIRINNQLFKNIFFFWMLILPYIWYQCVSISNFYLNFLLITYHFQISRFYNGYFLKIYSS